MSKLSIVILAAGQGKRMSSDLPKVLHPLGGVPMLERVVTTAQSLNPDQIFVVYGNGGDTIPNALPHLKVSWITQKEQLGTGHAVLQVLPRIPDDHRVLVLYGDVPLISTATLEDILKETQENTLALVITTLKNPHGFGRIIRDQNHQITSIIEEKDATSDEKAIQEINTGIMATQAQHLKSWLPTLNNKNAQGEYYLTDIVAIATKHKFNISGVPALTQNEVRGVNTLRELTLLERIYQYQLASKLLNEGVSIKDPHRFDVRGNLTVESAVTIDINVIFEDDVSIGEGSYIGAHSYLKNVTIGKHVTIKPQSVIEDAVIEDHCTIGPFARIRPNTKIKQYAKVGNFVEIKNTELGEYSKASHLTYLGDSTIGKNVNIGAGVITCNYDGVNKHKTTIKEGASIGADTQLIAPVTVHKNATVGAGSTITEDAPENTLTLARAKQKTIEGWERPIATKKATIED